ncbi:hypothetical protein BUALT_Bualt01G0143700 [Buddleja alternifolia]|uniref:Uncharacterized protein n=1 Tax=Buddleja alternifolia TaxID=168488 RepID=A0AAV6YEV0_9LAMI|nr:hypothetical protein BUALT_Bualt01G0143700 [Buddleja alternifolia]
MMQIKENKNRVEIVVKSIKEALKALRKPAIAAVVVGLLLLHDPSFNVALAASSGGRMGGRSFSSSSSSRLSSSYSVPRGESGFSYSVPYYGPPSPFGGVYVGPAVGIGSSFFLIMSAFAAFVLVSGFLSDTTTSSSMLSATEKTTVGLLGLGKSLQKDLNRIAETADTSTSEGLHYVLTETILALLRHPDYCISSYSSVSATGTCAASGPTVSTVAGGGSAEMTNAEAAEVAAPGGDTRTSGVFIVCRADRILAVGFSNASIRVFIHVSIRACSSVDVKSSMDEGEKRFNELSIEERGKFDEETLVNVNNIKKQSSTTMRGSGFSNEYIVLTILVAAGGLHKLPCINSSKDLKEALQNLASIPSSRTLAVEVLWTPQNEDDTLSERELLEDYPLLRPL